MPRLSLYKPEKGADYKFLDRTINEQFQVGGTDVLVHKYLGPVDPAAGDATPTTPVNNNPITGELGIQDVLLLENRDRHYDPDVYYTRGIYDMQDIDFNLSQFGLFLQNDTINLMFHLKTNVETLGRKIMAGDVVELPHQKDEYALDDAMVALKRFYVVQDVRRPAKGYSATWYPHLVLAKCVPLIDSQEFKEILDADSGAGDGSSLRDLMSTYKANIEINDQIIAQAEADAPKSGYNITGYYIIPTRDSGLLDVADASDAIDDASIDKAAMDASIVLRSPSRNLYVGYLTGDGVPPNGAPFNYGVEFSTRPIRGEFFLRTDYMPNRLFRYNGTNWTRWDDDVRMTMNNLGYTDVVGGFFNGQSVRETQKTSFINNTNTATINGSVVTERQALSKALKPKADN
jgi:hypothetical protein